MDPRPSHAPDTPTPDSPHAVLNEVTCRWEHDATAETTAVVLHAAGHLLILEVADPQQVLPPVGTSVRIIEPGQQRAGRLAEHGRAGRFLVTLGDRPVRRALRLKVSLPATLRSRELDGPRQVELVDLTTGGARVRGIELPVHSQVTLDFTPPGRSEPVTVRASVAHSTHGGKQPWIGVAFRLVALRGGR
jgi:hypothetical protein